MTPEKRATALVNEHWPEHPGIEPIADAIRKAEVTQHNRDVLLLQEKVEGFIRDAVAEEREACAKLVEDDPNDEFDNKATALKNLANTIRARS